MIEALALKIAKAIKKIEPNQTASIEVMKFSLEFIMNSTITLAVISIIGLFTGTFWLTLLGLLAFVVLRFFSGGLHLQKALHCSLVTTLLITLAPHLTLSDMWIKIVLAASLILILIFAPSNIEGHARIPKKYFPLLKLISASIVLSNAFFLISTIAIVHFIQASTTITLKRR